MHHCHAEGCFTRTGRLLCAEAMAGPTALQQPKLAGALLRQAPARPRTAPRRCVTTAGVRKVNTYDESWKKVSAGRALMVEGLRAGMPCATTLQVHV